MAAHKNSPRPAAQRSTLLHHRSLDAAHIRHHCLRTEIRRLLPQKRRGCLRRYSQNHQLRLRQRLLRALSGQGSGGQRLAERFGVPVASHYPVVSAGGQGQRQGPADQPQPQNKDGGSLRFTAHS